MPMSADGVDVLRRMTEEQKARREAHRNMYETSPQSEEDGSFLGTLFKLLLLSFVLYIAWTTGSTP